MQSVFDKWCSCSWTVNSLKFCWEIRALWKVILVAEQLLSKNNEIYFLMFCSYVITFLIFHWHYPHIKFRHRSNVSVHDPYIPSSSFLILLYQTLPNLLCWHKNSSQASLHFCYFIYYCHCFIRWLFRILLATMSEIFSFYFGSQFSWSLSFSNEWYICYFCSILEL